MTHGDTVARHQIKEACFLTGKGRKTIYRHMNSGKVAYGIDESGKRFLDTSELIRVYGELKQVPKANDTQKCVSDTLVDTLNDTPDIGGLFRELINEVKNLREETKELRKELSEKKALPAPVSLPDKRYSANELFSLSKEENARNESIKSSLANLRKKIEGGA